VPRSIGRPVPVVPATPRDSQVQRGRKTVVVPDSRYIGGLERRRVGAGTRLATVILASGYAADTVQTATFFTLGRVPTSMQQHGVIRPAGGTHPAVTLSPENTGDWTPTSVQFSARVDPDPLTASVTVDLLIS